MTKNKNNRWGMAPSSLVFGLIVFFMMISGFGMFFSELGGQYNYTSPAIDKYNNMTGVSTQVKSMGSAVSNSTIVQTDIFLAATIGAWNSIKLFFSFGDTISTLIGMVVQDPNFALPSWLEVGLNALVLSVITFGIISAIFRKEV